MSRIAAVRVGATLALLSAPIVPASAQTTFQACRVPNVGAIYMIGVAGAPSACLDASHVAFSWTEGGTPADGSITAAKLAPQAVTPSKIVADSIWNFFGPQGLVRIHPTFAPLASTTLVASFSSTVNPGPQARFDGSTAGFWDVGLNAAGNLVIENSDVATCTLTTAWSCPAAISAGSVGTAQLADGAVTAAKIDPAVGLWSIGGAVVRTSAGTAIAAGAFLSVSAYCLSGELAVGGGGSNSASGTVFLTDSFPAGGTGWTAYFKNSGVSAETITAWVVCAS